MWGEFVTFSGKLPAKDFMLLARRVNAVHTKSPIPILEHAMFKGSGDSLSLSATNGDQTVTASVRCEGSGSATAPLTRLSAAINALDKNSDVTIVGNGSGLTISQGRSRFQMPSLDPSDWPTTRIDPITDAGIDWNVPAPELMRSLRDLEFVTDDAKTRPYLAGMFFDTARGQIVATNSYGLGRDAAPWCSSNRPGFILPSKSARVVWELISASDKVRILANQNCATFESDGVWLKTSFIDAQYPEYDRFIPEVSQSRFRLKASALASALKSLSVVGQEGFHGSGINIVLGNGEMHVSSKNGDASAETACECETIEGNPVTLGAGSKWLNWASDSLDASGDVDILAKDSVSPFLITPAGNRDFIRLVVAMDMCRFKQQTAGANQ